MECVLVHGYADYVHKITFIDSLYGWGCGYRHNPYPTQPGPLMLITTNGGQTWNAFQPPAFGIELIINIRISKQTNWIYELLWYLEIN